MSVLIIFNCIYLKFILINLLLNNSCENDINECQSNPCHNNGTCTDLLGEFNCNCTDLYEGKTCEQLKLVTCDNRPCKNGGHCSNIQGNIFKKI